MPRKGIKGFGYKGPKEFSDTKEELRAALKDSDATVDYGIPPSIAPDGSNTAVYSASHLAKVMGSPKNYADQRRAERENPVLDDMVSPKEYRELVEESRKNAADAFKGR